MGVNSLPKTVSRRRRDCDLKPGPTAPESSTLTTRLPSYPVRCLHSIMHSNGGSTPKIAPSLGDPGPHLIEIRGSLAHRPPKSTGQTESRSVQSSLQGSWLHQTDTHRPRNIGINRPHLFTLCLRCGLIIYWPSGWYMVLDRERKCADTTGTVLVPCAGDFQC